MIIIRYEGFEGWSVERAWAKQKRKRMAALSGQKQKHLTPKEKLERNVEAYLNQHVETSSNMMSDLPRKWRILGDLAVLPANCFTVQEWNNIGI
jgi:hypothetical protein